MCGVYPGMTPLYPDSTASLAAEGTLWFTDLTLTDPYFILPSLLVITNFFNIEVNNCCAIEVTIIQCVVCSSIL